jgi:ABC-type transport system involved in cytochrome c biogenesis ATPase subunit
MSKIKIELNQLEYKSFKQSDFPVELEGNLIILTGVNGAGKTHLLTGINESIINIYYDSVLLNSKNTFDCKYLTGNTLIPNDSSVATKEQTNQTIDGFFNQYRSWKDMISNNPVYNWQNAANINQLEILNLISDKSKKEILNLNSEDFHNHYPIHDKHITDAFQNNLSTVFKRYHSKLLDNEFKEFQSKKYADKNIIFLTHLKFRELNGEAPWDQINNILEVANLDYRITFPAIDSSSDAQFEAKLVNLNTYIELKFSDLSSGEKVLISLVLAQYNLKNNYVAPKLLIFDEPDGSLHPSMVKQFLHVIQKVFVEQKGIKVILTTHSPTTVALAPEESLYLMDKIIPRIQKVSKDKALEVLMVGLPAFSVLYENRRQIFVEDQNDVGYYEKLYLKLKPKLIGEISLSFISSGESRVDKNGQSVTGCDQVKNITDILTSAGNKFIRGLVDWDLKNKDSEYIKVLGINRYSIENYLFDPILLSALLLREKIITGSDLGVSSNLITDYKNYSEQELQIISDYMVLRIKNGDNSLKTDICESFYSNGLCVKIPKWYLEMQGHDLENKIKTIFPKLNRYNKENELKNEIIDKVIDNIPDFIPKDIIDVFIKLQEYLSTPRPK